MPFSNKDAGSPTSATSIPLTDLESGAETGSAPSWTSLSDFHPSHIAAHSERLAPQFKQLSNDWLVHLDIWFTKLAIALTPSFLQHYVGGEPPKNTKLHTIAALDGLRGWACLLVFNFHFLFTYTWKVAVGWGFAGENFSIFQLPIIHLLTSGHIMVAIFFVISGYVLSYKPLKMIRSRSWEQTFAVLASSTFRRGLRLYIPSIIGILLVMLAVRAGIYDYSQVVINRGETILGTNEQHPPIMRKFNNQFWDWYLTVVHLVDPWNWALYYNYYNPHLWTIPVEFRCSIVLFLTMLATSRLRTPIRITLVFCLLWFCVRWGRWDVVLFLSGNLMAEFDLINGTWEPPSANEKPTSFFTPQKYNSTVNLKQTFRRYSRTWWLAIFIVGLYIGSSPNTGYKWTPGYMWLFNLTPKTYPEPHRFPQTIGAVLIVMGINHSKPIQKLFTNPVSQYLGKISFAFYIVHGPILHSLGYSIMPSIWNVVGKESDFQYVVGFLIGWMICLPISIWAGDLFWRAVDLPGVKFARWFEDRLIVKAPGMRNNPATPSASPLQ